MLPPVRRHLPNALTVLRLLLAGAFFLALNQFRYPEVGVWWANLAILIFIAAAASDWIDGWLARRWHVESTFGRVMDPFVDKVLILGAFIYLAGPRFALPRGEDPAIVVMATEVYPWMVVVIFARELLVTTIRGTLEAMGIAAGAKWSGKMKMLLQSIAIPVLIFLAANLDPRAEGHEWAMWAARILAYATVVVTLWSALPYITGLRHVLGPDESERRSP
jgi:CDP-diacylglycerol---glycerol-3-phosphate 3-phosphatidyltransferase